MLAGKRGCSNEINCPTVNSVFSWTCTVHVCRSYKAGFYMFPCTSASKYVFISSSMSFQQQDIMKGFYEWAMLFTGHVHCSCGTSLHVMAFKIRSIVPAVQVKYCWLVHAEALEWLFLDSLRNLKTRLLWQWCQDDELPEESHQLCLVLSYFVFIPVQDDCEQFFVWLLISESILVEKFELHSCGLSVLLLLWSPD